MARFFRIGLIVTGKGEAEFLPVFLRALATAGSCHVEVLRRIGQRGPVGEERRLRMVGRGDVLPTKDVEEIGLPARRYLSESWRDGRDHHDRLVILVDDLEHARRPQRREIFGRYRQALDVGCGPHYTKAAVHFLVNMLEAYYFADAAALVAVLREHGLGGTDLRDCDEDVETLRHPKNQIKSLAPGFREIEHGREVVARIDLEHVLARADTCGSLRALVGWCAKKVGLVRSDRFCLNTGIYDIVTGPQIGDDYKSLSFETCLKE